MWSLPFASYLLLVSLLIKDSTAGRYDVRKRDLYTVQHDIVVTEQVDVILQADGSTTTAAPYAVETKSYFGTPSLVVEQPPPPPTPEAPPAPEAAPEKAEDDETDVDDNDEDQDDVAPVVASPPPQPEPAATAPQQPKEALAPPAASVPPKQQQPQPEAPVAAVVAPTSVLQSNSQKDASSLFSTPSFEPAQIKPAENTSSLGSSAPSKFEPSGSTKNKGATQNGGGKRGIAYNDVLKLNAFASSTKVSWVYNWGSTTPVVPHEYEYVPMLWGLGHFTDGWFAAADIALATGSQHILSFNEPDLGAQASLTVPEAVEGYKKYVQPYAGKAKLGSPAVTNGGAPMGLSYLDKFITSCSGCTIDFIAIHWYNGGNAQDFKDYVTKAHNVGGGRPVWITEFEASGDQAQQQAFLDSVLPWLDSQDFVERYAYFMASDGNLISSGTSLSSVGQAFAFE